MITRRYFFSTLAAISIVPVLPVKADTEFSFKKPSDIPLYVADMIAQTQEVMQSHLFDYNDDHTRSTIRAEMAKRLDRSVTERKLYDGRAVCDATNNYPSLIDEHKLRVTLYVKPMHTADIYGYNLTIGPTGGEVEPLTLWGI